MDSLHHIGPSESWVIDKKSLDDEDDNDAKKRDSNGVVERFSLSNAFIVENIFESICRFSSPMLSITISWVIFLYNSSFLVEKYIIIQYKVIGNVNI